MSAQRTRTTASRTVSTLVGRSLAPADEGTPSTLTDARAAVSCASVCVLCVCVCWFDDPCDRNFYLFPPDINECVTGVDECAFSEFCRDTVGSYQCGCPAGYRLAADGKTCDGEVKCIA